MSTPRDLGSCKFCGTPKNGDPGDYYHYHDCWRRDVALRLARAREQGADDATIEALEAEYERASYVGD